MPVLKNSKRERFCQLIVEGVSQEDAYERVGYRRNSGNTSTLVRKKEIQSRIREIKETAARSAGITIERVLTELGKIGFANMLDYIQVTEGGQPYLDLSKLTREQAAAIQEITVDSVTEYEMGEDGKKVPVQVRKARFKLADKRAALVDIGKHFGAFKERVEHTGADGGAIKYEVTGAADEVIGRIAGIASRVGTEEGTRRAH